MKLIFGLDLGTTSVGWAAVREKETDNENSEIINLGVRLVPLSSEDIDSFNKKDKTTAQGQCTLKRGARRNLQRYKLRKGNLIEELRNAGIIDENTILTEDGAQSTYETIKLRAKAVTERISLAEFARVLLAINKKRGYKSNRKAQNDDDGTAIDSIDIAKILSDEHITPGQFALRRMEGNIKKIPDFYRSDLIAEFDKIWAYQSQFYPALLTDAIKDDIVGKNAKTTWAILNNKWEWQDSGITMKLQDYKQRGLKGKELQKETLEWRVAALSQQMSPFQLAEIFKDINAAITRSSGYLGDISDRSKQLYFNNQTVGQYLWARIEGSPNVSLKNQPFNRADYIHEFDTIWETQSRFYSQLTPQLKQRIRNNIIFYQRRLKSQKSLIKSCELISREIVANNAAPHQTITVGPRVAPRSSPIFQTFKIRQKLNDVKLTEPSGLCRPLSLDEKHTLALELSVKDKLSAKDILTILIGKSAKKCSLNFKEIQGDTTAHALYKAYSEIIEDAGYDPLDYSHPTEYIVQKTTQIFESLGISTDILSFDVLSERPERTPYYELWQLLYSFEDDPMTGVQKLIDKLKSRYGFSDEQARIMTKVSFLDDYANISAKAIKMLLPPMINDGLGYADACKAVGLNHSQSSITKEDNDSRQLDDKLEQLPKNTLRNPTVEKILNQMNHVVNELIATYGRPDEIRVELARELKKNKEQRLAMQDANNVAQKENQRIIGLLQSKGIKNVSRNDIIRWRLYEELKPNAYKALYSDKEIKEEDVLSGNNIDIEHIIPQSVLFDDSYSNKTLEYKDVNIDKGNMTAIDFVESKYGAERLQQYLNCVESIFKDNKAKLAKLKMRREDIPADFIARDIRETQYISRQALTLLKKVCRSVLATSGTITSRLREDWQLIDVMKELNLDKYRALGLVETFEKNGKTNVRIKDWTKRNDHRHHALDALTVAFSSRAIIQYLNTMNAADDVTSIAWTLKQKYVKGGKIIAPMPVDVLRAQAKHHLENILISIKAKNKVVTKNHRANDTLTPRGALHNETIYGLRKIRSYNDRKIDKTFDYDKIKTVANKIERRALQRRLNEFGGDPVKAFSGKNTLSKNPIWLDDEHTIALPEKVKVIEYNDVYTKREAISPGINIRDVIDSEIRTLLEQRLAEYGGNPKNAFANLENNPIWFNREKGIAIKSVTLDAHLGSPISLHYKHDHTGKPIRDSHCRLINNDFVKLQGNHHVALFEVPKLDKSGMQTYDKDGAPIYTVGAHIVSFYEAVERATNGYDIVDRTYNHDLGWKFLYTIKHNEFFVFPDEEHGFNPHDIDLTDPANRQLISQHLYRVQKFSSKEYVFRLHIDTSSEYISNLQDATWKRITAIYKMKNVIKVRLNHMGMIVAVGE